MNKRNFFFLLFISFFCNNRIIAQDVMLQSFYWDYPKGHWADSLKSKADVLGQAGFNYLWLPPHYMSSSGSGSNGYNPQDLYDLGEFAGGTGLGTRTDYNEMITELQSVGINPVGDMVYNHRDGGKMENNPGLKNYVLNFSNPNCTPFPADRYRLILPIGGTTGNGAGSYYIKFRSKTGNARFYNWQYKMFIHTSLSIGQYAGELNEAEPNGGGGQANETFLTYNMNIAVDNGSVDPSKIDEFLLTLESGDYNQAGDSLFIYLSKPGHGTPDVYIFEIWCTSTNQNIADQLVYQTFTNYNQLPSGRGGMDWSFFKPNLNNSTCLDGDWDGMMFFYDYDQFQQQTRDTLFEWTKWNWTDAGIRGVRMDAIKHFTPEFIGDLLDYLYDNEIVPGMVVGEWFDTNPEGLAYWINTVNYYMDDDTKNAITPRVFDFRLREHLRQACDDNFYDTRNLFFQNMSSMGIDYHNVVTFANNHDFREASGFNSLIHNNPLLAYAFILTNYQLGSPTVFYPDFFGYPADFADYFPENLPDIQQDISLLIQILRNYIAGGNHVEYLNRLGTPYFPYDNGSYTSGLPSRSLIYQISGGAANKEVIVAINFDSAPLIVDHEIRINNGLAVGSLFTELSGNSPSETALLATGNRLHVEVPAHSFSVWVQGEALGDIPAAPINLQATAISTSEISISWNDVADNETGFQLEKKTTGSTIWEAAATLPENSTNFNDTQLQENTTYSYRVYAFNDDGNSALSNIAVATTLLSPPLAPENLLATALSPVSIQLNWTDVSTNEAGFILERRTTGEWQEISVINADIQQYINNGLAENITYFYRIKAYNASGESDYSNETQATTPFGVPNPPSGLSATAVSSNWIDLLWNDNSTNELNFIIERKTGLSGSWEQIFELPANSIAYSDTENVLPAQGYFYRIFATNSAGNSIFSNEVYIVTPTLSNINAPSALQASALSATEIYLQWNDNSENEQGFLIQRKALQSSVWEIVSTTINNEYTDNQLIEGSSWFYRVQAFIENETSNFSNIVFVETLSTPATPTNLNGYPLSGTEINLFWNDNSNNENGFYLERKTENGNWQTTAELPENTMNYIDNQLVDETNYFYRISAWNEIGISETGNEIEISTLAVIPAAPTDLNANALSANQIELSWTDNADNENIFILERKNNNFWVEIAEIQANSTLYIDNNLNYNQQYFYRIKAGNVIGFSEYSNEAETTTLPAVPNSPSTLTATVVGAQQVALNWRDNADNEQGFKIERRKGLLGNWLEINSLASNIQSYSDAVGLEENQTYFYKIRAFNAVGFSEYSNTIQIVTGEAIPNAPTALTATAAGSDYIYLQWTDNSGNEEGFIVERRKAGATNYEEVTRVFANTNFFYDTNLEAGIRYFYQIAAFAPAGISDYCPWADATTFFVGIESIESQQFTIFPNPAKNILSIKTPVLGSEISKEVLVDVININGSLLDSFSIENTNLSQFEINVAELNSGIYFLRILCDGKFYHAKFMKE